LIVAAILASSSEEHPVMVDLPTGLGKSIICYLTAMVLQIKTGYTVLLVSQNEFSKLTSCYRYAIAGLSDILPSARRSGARIWHLTFQELLVMKQKEKLQEIIVIVDEFD
jgi:ERCC4-related helicase